MAYYSGMASSYNDLLTALVNACTSNGWTLLGDVLSKPGINIKLFVENTGSNSQGPGLIARGVQYGVESSRMRIGPASENGNMLPPPAFPISYNIFIFNDPAEVFLVVKYDIDRFQFLAFGLSNELSDAVWLSASLGGRYAQSSTNAGIYITETTGGLSGGTVNVSCSGFFWQTRVSGTDAASQEVSTQDIYINFDGIGWSSSKAITENVQAVRAVQPLISRIPSAFSSEAVFLPIQITVPRASSKLSIIADIKNARFLRIDNYEPGQVLTIGAEKWMVFPFHKKNSAARNGGSYIDHTGTFGWVIRYDGP